MFADLACSGPASAFRRAGFQGIAMRIGTRLDIRYIL
jgi:hypothetical protein